MRAPKNALVIAAAALFVCACGGEAGEVSGPKDVEADIQADYPVYGSVEELWGRADLIAEIVVDGDGVADRLFPTLLEPGDEGYGDPAADPLAGLGQEAREKAETDLAADEGVPITVVDARITKVWKGAQDSGMVTIQQLGNSDVVAADVTYLVDGGRHLVFLETYEDAPASLLNPWQAQYSLNGNAFRELDTEYALGLTTAQLEALQRSE